MNSLSDILQGNSAVLFSVEENPFETLLSKKGPTDCSSLMM